MIRVRGVSTFREAVETAQIIEDAYHREKGQASSTNKRKGSFKLNKNFRKNKQSTPN